MLRGTRSWLLAVLVAGTPLPHSATAQSLAELTATPESTAELFLRSVRAIRWSAAAQFMHAETLDSFRDVVRMMVETDTTGALRRDLTSTATESGFAALAPEVVFDRAIGRMVDDMPGFMHSLFDHDDDVIGHVREGSDSAHVVYRTIERISGAVPEVRVIQMARTREGWRVLWSDELAVLEAALRGIPRTRQPPPPPGEGPGDAPTLEEGAGASPRITSPNPAPAPPP